ncbi:hypothetical protein BTJ39_00195 [Izhakiella australiensis]|uniref:Peptidase S74 domain-containing protein n=1 Tax=Izhakiella australiensis TaxID=1926881 RepID=A0A1S8YS20_9GAMM|nr:phage tail fiber protein [Izhakiella australiensis]OON41626.1 hypothetical protein BTJ39_00195 [Izhakiella australiensis]
MSVPEQTPISGPYIANGSTTQFSYTFYLLYETDLNVYVGGALKTLGTDYTVTGVGNSQGGNVVFTVAPAAGLEVIIRRDTPYTRQTDYADNGDLLADVVNDDFDRLWLALQEIFANFSSSISKPVGGNWDAQGLRITSVADGTQPQDAVTLKQLTTVNGSAGQSAAAAAASAAASAVSAAAAKISENNAKTSETNAKTSETNAAVSATNAGVSETNAAASAAAAKTSETNAKTSETNAANSAAAAKTDADRAKTEADKLADVNAFATTIKSVDVANSVTTFKGAQLFEAATAGAGSSSITTPNGAQIISMTVPDGALASGGTITGPSYNTRVYATNGDFWQTYEGFVYTQAGDIGAHRWSISRKTGAAVATPASMQLQSDHTLRIDADVVTNGQHQSWAQAPVNPPDGAFINTPMISSQLRGRGATADPRGAYCGFYLQEYVGHIPAVIININGYGSDQNWAFRSDGALTGALGAAQWSGSDVRIKDDIEPAANGAGERVDKIGVVEYTEISTGRRRRGWIAQQVDEIDPHYTFQAGYAIDVNGEKIDILNTDDRAMIADLIAEVQSLRQRVAALEAK